MTATISIPVTEATPAQIDRELNARTWELAKASGRLDGLQNTKARQEGKYFYGRKVENIDELIAEAVEAVATAEAQIAPLHAEWDLRGGWTRYYLVTDGHLHYDISDYRCSRTRTTRHHLMDTLSGLTAEQAIEVAGERVCTTCFPQAPVDVTKRKSILLTQDEREREAARQERQAAKDERARKAAEKAIALPDGTPLVEQGRGYPETIKTEATAKVRLVDLLWYAQYYGADAERDADIETILVALAHKHGVPVEQERAAADKRLAARIKREGG